MRRPPARALLAVTAAAASLTLAPLAATATPAAPAAHQGHGAARSLPSHIDLPDGFQPEGIAVSGGYGYVGSRVTGDIYRFSRRTGEGAVFATGPGTPSLGLKIDAEHGRIYVAGGTGGDARVLSLSTGRTLASYRLTSASSFVNDAVIRPHAVWITDSAQAQLYKLPLGKDARLPRQGQVRTVPLTGQWRQVDGTNANGITATPDGSGLLVVNSATGKLYRVGAAGRARLVRLRGTLLNGDGLLLRGRTLLAVRNTNNKIAVVGLDRRGRAGTVTGFLRSSDFDVPSTVAAQGRQLYLPNARFTTTPTPTTQYWVTRLVQTRG